MDQNHSAITILAAMITPAVLILASGSLSLTTSQRLHRSVERTRKIYADFEDIKTGKRFATKDEKELLNRQLQRAATRAILMQRAMTLLYIAICFFISTSLLLGLFELFDIKSSTLTITTAMLGALLLLAASILLILETRHGLGAVNEEMNYRKKHNYLIEDKDEHHPKD